MLKSLTIDNYVIISNLYIEWAEGLNIVTGRTGAGKSVILGALSLLFGQKADVSQLLDKQRNLVVEAVFDIAGYALENFLSDNDIDYEDEITVRRQIAPNGKSRCFVEDIPVSQQFMKELSSRLIDIHSQHQSLLLARERFQMDILDSIAGVRPLRGRVQEKYEEYVTLKKETEALRSELEATERDKDYISFQLEQLEKLCIKPGETALLTDRLSIMEHSEDIARSLSAVYETLEGSDNALIQTIQQLGRCISSQVRYMETLSAISDRLSSSAIELKDIAQEAEQKLSSISFNPDEKQSLEKRLDEINDALAKHGVNTEEELLEKLSLMRSKLDSMEEQREKLSLMEKQVSSLYEELRNLCADLTAQRIKNQSVIEKHVIKTLEALGIEKSRFKVDITPKDPSSDGADNVEFLFSANTASLMQPISKAASGGEISRLMLALKSLAATRMKLPTIVFDEIDTGVSGAVADSMGEMISSMATSMQVINITHLPQVAAKGNNHYEVYKKDSATYIKRLSDDERVEKIAEMLSGADITDAARQQAKKLLEN